MDLHGGGCKTDWYLHGGGFAGAVVSEERRDVTLIQIQ